MSKVSVPIVLGGTLAVGLITRAVVSYLLARDATIPSVPDTCGFLECMFDQGAAQAQCEAACDAARARRDAAYDEATLMATPVALGFAAIVGGGLYTYGRYW